MAYDADNKTLSGYQDGVKLVNSVDVSALNGPCIPYILLAASAASNNIITLLSDQNDMTYPVEGTKAVSKKINLV